MGIGVEPGADRLALGMVFTRQLEILNGHLPLRSGYRHVILELLAQVLAGTLPVAVSGSASTKVTSVGSHHDAILGFRNSISSGAVTCLSGRRTTTSNGRSCQRGWGMPITAASATAG